MGIRIVSDSLGDIPSELQDSATEADGVYSVDLSDHPKWSVEPVADLKSTLAKERRMARELRARIEKDYTRDGEELDANAAWSALERLRELEESGGEDESKDIEALRERLTGQFTEKEKRLAEKHQRELAEATERAEKLSARLDDTLIDTALTEALAKADCINHNWVKPTARKMIRTVELDNGERVPRVFDREGNERITMKSGSQEPMTAAELIAEMSKENEWAGAFKGTGASGTGMQPGLDAKTGNGRFRITRDQARDYGRYKQLKAEAEKAGTVIEVVHE